MLSGCVCSWAEGAVFASVEQHKDVRCKRRILPYMEPLTHSNRQVENSGWEGLVVCTLCPSKHFSFPHLTGNHRTMSGAYRSMEAIQYSVLYYLALRTTVHCTALTALVVLIVHYCSLWKPKTNFKHSCCTSIKYFLRQWSWKDYSAHGEAVRYSKTIMRVLIDQKP